MFFSIITPSFKQLDWLRLCVASVRDQVEEKADNGQGKPESRNPLQVSRADITVEHIIQDAGTPGIEDFAREIGADFYRGGALQFDGPHGHAGPDSAKNPKSDCTGSGGEQAAGLPKKNPQSEVQDPESIIGSPSFRYRVAVYSERDAGMYDAVNRGFEKARGNLLAYLNCDEQYLPGALAAVARRFSADPSLGLLFGDAVVVEGDGRFLCFRKAQTPFRDQLWFRMPVLTCATFLRREVFFEDRVRLDETKKVLGDVIWIMRAQERGIRMGVLRRFTSVFTETETNLGLGGAADREFLDLQAGMPAHVKRWKPLYEFWHKVRSLLSGTRHAAPFSYEIYTDFDVSSKKSFFVPHPTAVWKGRTGIDKKVLGG